ncbi:hypothetical protein [Microbacterium murale]|uniref:hypothetical protein n=1 Tax=Microbacterium murale TaxID=1081040 RepID=UPI00166470F1|nr:hypothetical protein [Microbacterium murale]
MTGSSSYEAESDYAAESEEIARDARRERHLLWQGVVSVVIVAGVVVLRELFLR